MQGGRAWKCRLWLASHFSVIALHCDPGLKSKVWTMLIVYMLTRLVSQLLFCFNNLILCCISCVSSCYFLFFGLYICHAFWLNILVLENKKKIGIVISVIEMLKAKATVFLILMKLKFSVGIKRYSLTLKR